MMEKVSRWAAAPVRRALILLMLAASACSVDPDVTVRRSAATSCTQDSDCNDGVPCTADICNLVNHTCLNLAISGCCTQDSDCDDGTACTQDACSVSQGRCLH